MATAVTNNPTSTANNAASTLNMLRISGLASGIDTESMVKSLMAAQSYKYNKMVQQKQTMDWTKEAQLAVNNELKTFQDTYFSMLNPSTSMLTPNSILLNKVTADANSSVTFSANSDAFTGGHRINSITSLASGANAASSAQVSAAGLTLDTKLSDLALNTPLSFDGNGQISFAINGSTFKFKSSDTLRTMLSVVNSDADANVQMTYSSLTGKFTVANKTMGSTSALSIQNISGNAFGTAASGGTPAIPGALGMDGGAYSNGTDAHLNIDGVDVVKNSNVFTIDGITYNLKSTTGTPVNFSVDQDIDGAVSKIEKFIGDYNKVISDLSDKVNEKKDSDYAPLTADQKSQMNQTQIDQWEAKAKTGLLGNDDYIENLLGNLRGAFYDNVKSAGTNAAAIGLGTFSYETGGAISVDETALRKALESNPQQVAQVLTGRSASTNPATKYSESGLMSRMQASVSGFLNDYNGYRTDSFNTQYRELTSDISDEQTRLNDKETQYWNEFTQMEQAIASMNEQSSWLSQQLGSSSSSNG